MHKFIDTLYYFFNGPAKLLHRKIRRSGQPEVCIYGAGVIGKALIEDITAQSGLSIYSVIDRKADFVDESIDRFTIQKPSSLASLPSGVPIAVASEAFTDEIKARIKDEMGGRPVDIILI